VDIKTALHYACQNGHFDSVRVLVEAGANPNVQKNNGTTPLITACAAAGFMGKQKLKESIQCVECLLESPQFDLEVNDNSDEMRGPPWICVNREYREPDALLPLLNLLLEKGFDPNGNIHNMSALHMAIMNGHKECALALVRAGADIQTKGRKVQEDVNEELGLWTALEASEMLCGASFTRCLWQEAANRSTVAAKVTTHCVHGRKS